MATALDRPARRAGPISADAVERALAYGAPMLLAAAFAAVARGQAERSRVPASLWLHLLTKVVALAPVFLLRARGDARRWMLGRIWS